MFDSSLKNILSKLTILYIEDDNSIRDNFCEFFKRFKSKVFCVSNAEDGLKIYESHKIDIIIVDINLPNMSGIELVSQIRKNDKLTRVIITTAYTNPEFTVQAIEQNLTRYIVKPITSNNLIPALEKAVLELKSLENKYTDIKLGNGFIFNGNTEQLFHNGIEIALRKKELMLLKYLIENKHLPVTYEMLEHELWNNDIMTVNAIRGQVRNLREKTHKNLIQNISGVGYKINCED